MRTWYRLAPLLLLFVLLFAGLPLNQAAAQNTTAGIVSLRLEGALHPVMLEYLKRAQQIAERDGAQAIILELDTPGGDIQTMNQLVESIRASKIPVIVYVSPRGAMAASAGTIITLAGHLSAMAPETAIGAASPVGPNGEDIGTTMQSKVKGMLKATAHSLASSRSPEALKLADEMIDNARAVSVDEALKAGLVDIKASDQADLLRQLDGRKLTVNGQAITMHTGSGVPVNPLKKTFMEDMLMVLANPNIAFLLLAIGVQAILIEISSPGGWVAGFIGAVCLLLATYGMGLLPVNWFGLLFLALAFVLFILDIKAPTHGALTLAGVGAFILGALVLFNSPNVPSFQRVSVPLVVGTGLMIGLFFFVLVGFALRAQHRPLLMGSTLVGQVGTVTSALNPTGTVQLGSELWTAVSESHDLPVPRGSQVQVVAQERLKIRVKKVEE